LTLSSQFNILTISGLEIIALPGPNSVSWARIQGAQSLKLTVASFKLEKIFEIDREFSVKRPLFPQILDPPLLKS
jgi:hypothetical protein